jgi:hypothetical protein
MLVAIQSSKLRSSVIDLGSQICHCQKFKNGLSAIPEEQLEPIHAHSKRTPGQEMNKKTKGQLFMPDVATHPPGMPPADIITAEVKRMGLTEEDANAITDYWLANGFKHGRNPVKSWTAVLRNWKRERWFPSQKTSKDVANDKLAEQLSDLKDLRRRYSGDGQNRLL